MTVLKFTNGKPYTALKSLYSDVPGPQFNPEPYAAQSVTSRVPFINIAESENNFQIELATPGLKKSDFKINIDKDKLTISTNVNPEPSVNGGTKTYNRKEFNYNSFSRTFTLPESADTAKIEAEYTDGILSVIIAKKEEAKIKVREISVK